MYSDIFLCSRVVWRAWRLSVEMGDVSVVTGSVMVTKTAARTRQDVVRQGCLHNTYNVTY